MGSPTRVLGHPGWNGAVLFRVVHASILLVVACHLMAGALHAQRSSGTVGNSQSKPTLLELSKPIEREIHGGEKHSYKVHAESRQFIHAVIVQHGIHVSASASDATGKQIPIADSMNGSYGPEPVSIIPEHSGDVVFEVSASSTDTPSGHYQIRLTDLRVPTESDRIRIYAERTYMEGVSLLSRGGVEPARAAAEKWQESFALWQSLNDKYGQALSLLSKGLAFQSAGDTQRSLLSYKQSLAVWRVEGDRAGEATTLNNIGADYYSSGEKQKALEYFNQSLPFERLVGDRASERTTLENIGKIYEELGENQKALDYYSQALPLVLAAGNEQDQGRMLNEIGSIYDDLGEKPEALDYFNRTLPLARAAEDRKREANTLNNIGKVYNDLGEKQKALDYYAQALPLYRALGDRKGEANTLNNTGSVYGDLGETQKALDYFNEALTLVRAAGNDLVQARTLNNIASVYAHLGENQKALTYFNEALPLVRTGGGVDLGQSRLLNNIGSVYENLGEVQKALDFFNQALPIQRYLGDRGGEAVTLNNIGSLYNDLGEKQRALDYFNQALPLYRTTGDRMDEAMALNNIGSLYNDLGEKQKALIYFNQALPLQRSVEDRRGEAITLGNMGTDYSDLGEEQKALDYYSQALLLQRSVGDRPDEATTLNNIGVSYSALGEKQKALDYYTQSLPLSRAVEDPLQEGSTLVSLMEYWDSLQNPSLAILFGKQAVDRFQQVRRNISGLGKEARQSFLKSKEDDYRELAELLISAARLPEAQQVLDLLKEEEYSEFTHRRGDAGSGTDPVALTPMEEKFNREYELITGEITAYGAEWTQLHAKSSRSAIEEKRYNDLSVSLTAANQRLQGFLNTLYASFGKGDQANAKVEVINEQTAGLQTLVGELGARTAAVYTLVLDDKYVAMVITPATRVAREVPINKIVLRGKVFAFARALAGHQPEADIQAKAQDLYKVLIAPIEKDLQGAQATTLVWSLDDVLRYVPLAALYDGKQYLVERFRSVVITTASAGNLKDQPQVSSWHGVGMGVSKDYDGLGPLKAVPDELSSVIHSDKTAGSHGPVPGTILLDDTFTETEMERSLEQHPPLVHIASHYVFQPGDDRKSYLLLGGKETGGQGFHLALAELRDDQKMDFRGIELLTLSGCQTAVGSNDSDGREIDGLGIAAQRKGAKAVMATLWPVDDTSVGVLMATFYKLWTTTPGMPKAEALQQAELALLQGPAAPSARAQGSTTADSSASASNQRPASPYGNPYYWAPFILIGNWK
jgi:CHAT domain-containing protein/tetratricopeptide (TPR) repeat protein